MSYVFRKIGSPAIVSSQIFGTRIGDGVRSGWKWIKQIRYAEVRAYYYKPSFSEPLRLPGMIDPIRLNNMERTERLVKKGKMPTRPKEIRQKKGKRKK